MISAEHLRKVLSYDPLTGVFTWKPEMKTSSPYSRQHGGKVAGVVDKSGYVKITIDRKKYYGHRLAWLYMHGELPSLMVDHKDLNKQNNAISNLRLATPIQSNANKVGWCKSGVKGAHRNTSKGKPWKSEIRIAGRVIYLGVFDTPEEAGAAYAAAALKYFGEFARTAPEIPARPGAGGEA